MPYWRDVISYEDYEGAMLALKKLGCKELVDLPSVILNTPKKPISQVKLGEPVYYINKDGVGILGVCNGARAYFLGKSNGLAPRPIENCKYCWSIN